MAGKLNSAKWGKCRRVDDHELDWHIREIGRLIRDARLERDVSQEELAAASGIGQASIVRIEAGKGRRGRNLGATVTSVIRIALALGMRPYEWLP
jgi:transcriptional regulator with XRE-family HTH domain